MAATTTEDDGFREIQLNTKQAFFLVMAATTVLVVAFMLGMLVGRGVRAEREETATADALVAPSLAAERPTPSTPDDADPRKAAPPAPAENVDADSKAGKPSESVEEPPVAVRRDAAGSTARSGDAAKTPAAPVPVAKATPPPTPAPVAAKPAAPAAAPTAAAASSAERSGFAVQVAAVNVRTEADAIVKRLSGKGYSAYVEVPKGAASTFRVRVGTFETRREAQDIADKLKNDENFKPWVTR
ncbi:MAG: SPOR domain-containing protein [Vicinamibacterales bacterium]